MSLDATRWAWMQQGLRPLQKLTLLSLADRADFFDCAFPSRQSLADDTGMDIKSVWLALKELQAQGLIEDTGERRGQTKQIPVWRLIGVEHRTAKGAGNDTETGSIPKTEGFRFSPESIPFSDRKAFRKRNTEPIREPINNQEEKRGTDNKAAKTARGARLSLSVLPDEWRAWARKERPDLDTEATWQIFTDYWKSIPGARGCKCDWMATWRNWVRREKNNAQKGENSYARLINERAAINREWLHRGQQAYDEMVSSPFG